MKKPKFNTFQACGFLVRSAWNTYKGVLWLALLQVLVGVSVNLLELFVTPTLLGSLEQKSSLQTLLAQIVLFTLGMLLAYGLQRYLQLNQLFGRVHVRVQLSQDIHTQFCRTAYPHVEDTAYLDLADRAMATTQSNQSATESAWATMVQLLTHGVCFLVYLLLLTAVNPWILAFTALLAVCGYLAGRRIRDWRHRHKEEENARLHRTSYAFRTARNRELVKDVRIFGLQSWLTDVCGRCLKLYQDFRARAEFICLWADLMDVVLAFLRNGLAYGYLLHMTLEGKLTTAEFMLYFSAVGGFTAWITGLLSDWTTLHRQGAELSTVMEFLTLEEPFRFADGQPLTPQKGHGYTLELRDVSFRYPEAKKDTLSHVDLTIAPGEKLAIVGLNGAGKTTLVKLLCGFLDPTEGQVLLDGQDIRIYDRRDYYKLFSAVFQDFSPLAATVAQNVAQCVEGMDLQRVRACLRQAGLWEKTESLGLDAQLTREIFEDGTELSGGEFQRLMLARALYKDGPILVLDEPTAALDPIAENDVYQKYAQMTRGCTSLFISHRLASTGFCDRIILLENGRIAEEGTHQALMARGGAYAKLFDMQSRYYREGGADHD